MGSLGRWARVAVAIALGAMFALTGTSHAAASLTPRQLAGQRVIYSYPGLTPPQSLLDRIRTGEAAGVIFFGENISGTQQIASVIAQLDAANAASPVKQPLLLMTDQEGGKVRRLPGEPTLSEKQIGASADPVAAATQAGTGAAQNLKSAGMNVNLAPVLDVYRTEGDFDDQYGRSYSKDPAVAGNLGKAFITAQQQGGVAAAAKHFPGLGSATADQNTDETAVTMNVPLQELRDVDEAPYPAALSAGVKLVMVSWATYPALDAGHPAGLSAKVVRDELRGRLGFGGVTVTDALEAGSLRAYGATGPRAVAAASAGMDLILASARDAAQGDDAADAMVSALQSGQLNEADFTAAADRVDALRGSLG
ncbi:glycoside hydrolase family 3 N-terminal domain-containing protein [Amycolatopsis sp.]|uniref:glycoside hydrolase family 3 N-terminal domain-containing protein n=1 Tax=Amycolatopsis sp. TaxID=37632 RepID=UPI002BB02A62|nr:glycoside hydrolase family 3 N-terminal domain-containing protein [Amycolatopsis sp.]HVV13401.1 glycoside hydrolase family 3 N-terminal domain-containing protein [Amycolatopsis sp.]